MMSEQAQAQSDWEAAYLAERAHEAHVAETKKHAPLGRPEKASDATYTFGCV